MGTVADSVVLFLYHTLYIESRPQCDQAEEYSMAFDVQLNVSRLL